MNRIDYGWIGRSPWPWALAAFILSGCAARSMPMAQEVPVPVAEEPSPPQDPVETLDELIESLPLGLSDPASSSELTVQKVWIWQETSDCLWNMAKEHYGNPFLWPKIYQANRQLIKNPNVIFPKQEILIPPLDDADGDEETGRRGDTR